MTIKTEVGTGIIIVFAIIAVVSIVIGKNKFSKNINTIESSVLQNKAALEEN